MVIVWREKTQHQLAPGVINSRKYLATVFFHHCATAVSAIVVATAVVVLIVAVTIALVLGGATCSRARALVLGIQARTSLAVTLFDSSTFDSLFTAVAAVVITATVVVFVVAIAVSLVLAGATHPAAGFICCRWFWSGFLDARVANKVKAVVAFGTLGRAVFGAINARRGDTVGTTATNKK